MTRAFLRNLLLLLLLGLLARPADAQLKTFRYFPPVDTLASSGTYVVRWEDGFVGDLHPGCFYSITWYYSTDPSGVDARRITTLFRDDFSGGFRGNWRPEGPFQFDWAVREDRRGRDRGGANGQKRYVSGPRQAGPLVSSEPTDRDVVLSALVRPHGRNEFSLGLRVQPNGRSYEIQNDNSEVRIVQAGKTLARQRLMEVVPRNWYWYEVGVRTRPNRDVELRMRVFDETRERVLVNFDPVLTVDVGQALKSGFISLTGPADFAEVYVDPWSARWADDPRNELRWDTSQVPDGTYYLIAEVADGKGKPRIEVSDYQVQVRNRPQAAAN